MFTRHGGVVVGEEGGDGSGVGVGVVGSGLVVVGWGGLGHMDSQVGEERLLRVHTHKHTQHKSMYMHQGYIVWLPLYDATLRTLLPCLPCLRSVRVWVMRCSPGGGGDSVGLGGASVR